MLSNELFDTVPDDLLAFGQGSDFQPRKVADWLNLDNSEVSKLSSVSTSSVRYDDHIPKAVLTRLEEIADICNMVAGIFDGDVVKAARWFRARNPMLGDMTPRDMIRLGRYARLRKYIVNAISERRQPAAAA